jgi:ABC-type multidrug transport system ATPase subunit
MIATEAHRVTCDRAGTPRRTVLDVEGVVRRFRNGRGVGPVTLRVSTGERVALMGPNGAGKSTLLRVMATADRPRRGVVRWYGSASPQAARRLLGTAPDVVVEDGALTARQSLHFWCRQWTAREAARGLVGDALSQFALTAVADEPISSFSFGMRRRLGLAQALVHLPRLALLDEPTSGLDPEGVAVLRTVLLHRTHQGLATVIASTDCAFVAAACGRVVFLDAGRVLRDASPRALLRELPATRVAELDVASDGVDGISGLAGVGAVQRENGAVRVELLDESALAAVVAAADAPGGNLRALRLHTPDLSDAFHALAGHSLEGRNGPTPEPRG